MSNPKWLRFEVLVAHILRGNNYFPVFHDVQFVKARGIYRQADIVYYRNGPQKQIGIVEVKYTSGSTVSFHGRAPKQKIGTQTIDNILDELEERRQFCHADAAVLVTNKRFDRKLHAAYSQTTYPHIRIVEEQQLTTMAARAGYSGDLQQHIDCLQLTSADRRKHSFPIV